MAKLKAAQHVRELLPKMADNADTFTAKLIYVCDELEIKSVDKRGDFNGLTAYLCAEHGMTAKQAGDLTPGQVYKILKADVDRRRGSAVSVKTPAAAHAVTKNEAANLIDQFIKHVGNYFSWNNLLNIQAGTNLSRAKKGEILTDADTERTIATDERYQQAYGDLLRIGRQLTGPLRGFDIDVKGLLGVMNAADGGGGPAAVWALWPAVKVQLQDAAMGLRAAPPAAAEAGAGATPPKTIAKPKRKGGRPGLSAKEQNKRLAAVKAWNKAKDSGETMKVFCQRQSEYGLRYLEKAVNWCSQQRRRQK